MKLYYEMFDIGKVKYLVNFHDGIKTHRDGSIFYDVQTFSNQKKKNDFIKNLELNGYSDKTDVYLCGIGCFGCKDCRGN